MIKVDEYTQTENEYLPYSLLSLYNYSTSEKANRM